MKALIVVVCFISVGSYCYAAPVAKVVCHFRDVTSGSVDVVVPVNHTVFWASVKTIPIGPDGNCTIAFEEPQTGYVVIRAFSHAAKLCVEEHDDILIDIDTSGAGALRFAGNNAAGNQLLSLTTLFPSFYDIADRFGRDTIVSVFSKKLSQEQLTKRDIFEGLYQDKKISLSFLNFVRLNLKYLYAAAAETIVSNRYYKTKYATTSSYYTPNFPQEYQDYWESLLNDNPVREDDAMRVPSFEPYIDRYASAYLDFKKDQSGDTSRLAGNQYINNRFIRIKTHFSRALAENVAAKWLYSLYIQNEFEPELLELFESYNSEYPKSLYTPFLVPYNQKVIRFQKSKNNSFNKRQVIISDYLNIKTFASLKEKFAGKMFYIDIWATWCGPCKDEFAHEAGLDSFLQKKNISMVYLSMDDDRADQQWKTMIKYFNLPGFHIRTSEQLRNDLKSIFWGGDGYAIPRYVLVNEKGEVVEKDALRPSDKDDLYRQISSHIGN